MKKSPTRIIEAPIRLMSELNTREHWCVRKKRKDEQQRSLHLHLIAAFGADGRHLPDPPYVVQFTRIGKRTLDPLDNLPSSFKHVSDELCRFLGVNDGKPDEVEFLPPKQIKGEYGVRVEIDTRKA